MVTIPGIAVGLLGLLGVLVAFGMIQLTRYWLRPLLYAFAAILRAIPVVGGRMAQLVLKFERIVDSWLASAAVNTERLAVGFFHGLTALAGRLGSEIAGLATDTYNALSRVVRVTVPRLLRAVEARLARLANAALALGRQALARLGQLTAALAARIAQLERFVQAEIGRAVDAAERAVLAALRTALQAFNVALHTVAGWASAALYRIGQLEVQVFNSVWPELRRLAGDLRPDRLLAAVLSGAWSLVPHELRIFFAWVWHWLAHAGEFLVALVTGNWPPPMHRATGRQLLANVRAESKKYGQGLRDELGRR